jgi:phosphoribosyl 1,2-cyclic phosphate phosphodiesterase
VKFSEGAMFKTSESKYLLNGRSSFWAKFKQFFELDAIVLGRKSKTNLSGPKKGQAIPGQWTYVCGYGPVKPSEDDPKILDAPVDEGSLADYVKLNDKIYGVLGNTFATAEDAKVGDILTVDFNLINKFGPTKYHWVLPRVIEKRPEKTKPDPIGVVDGIAQECTFRKKAPTKKAAFPLDTRMGIYSLISAKDPRKFVGINVDGEWNYAITRIPEALIAFLQKYDVNTYYTRDISPSVEAVLFLSDINVLPISSETVQDALDAYEYIDKEPDVFKVQADIWDIKRFYTENPQPGWGSKSFAATMDYLTIPPDGEYAFVAQAHVRGLSVHIDLRIALVRNKELIGWTMDALKSLIKVAIKRYADDAILSKFGLSKSQVDGMAIKDVSQKLNSSLDGRHFMDALSDKIEKLPDATIMTMIHELIKEELLPILDSPERKILLQTKEPEPYEWISYEGRVSPGGVGATAEHAGRFFIVDRGVLEYGAQKEHYHEYWLNGKIFNGHFVVRRLPTAPKWELKSTFAWMGFFTLPDKLPYTITKRAIDKGYMPPDGRSALPAIIRKQVDLYPYWKYKGKEAKNMRDALVTAIKKTDVKLKFARGLKFAIKQFWYRGPVHVRGAPNVFYYLIFHDGNKVLKTFDFGEEDPEGRPSVTMRLGRSKDPMMIKKTGVLPASHILNPNEKLIMNMDTVDEGSLELIADSSNFLRFKLDGGKFKGLYVIYRENPSSEEWFFKKAELPEPIKASMFGYYAGGLGTQGADFAVNELEDILVISGPFLRPGEMIGLDMRPTYFPPQSIEPITITGVGTPIIMMHGDLKGDVVGYVQKVSVKDGVGYCDVGIIFHPKAIKSILSHQTPDFSIELLPKSVWDAEHQREVVLSGVMVGLGIVTRGAGKDLHIQTAKLMKPPTTGIAKKVFGIPLGDYLKRRYWQEDVSTVELAEEFSVSETAVKKMFEALSIPMRTLQESAEVRRAREKTIKKFGGAIQVSFLGTGANTIIPQPGCDCPQCVEARKGGPSRRNHSSMLITYGGENLILDAPEEIVDLLGMKKIIPDHVLITHAHPDHAGGLKFMTNKNLNVYAPANVWDKLENINNMPFHKRVVDITPFKIGPFLITAFKVAHSTIAPAVAYKIRVGEARTFFYAPDVLDIPNKKEALKDVDVFIGDGSALKQEIVKQVKGNEAEVGHASMEDEIGWAGTAEIPEVIFTHIGHVKMGHDELNKQLRVMAPNATAANDGASGLITDENPGHKLSEGHAKLLWEGKKKIIVTTKPYMRYATKVIFFIDEDKVYGRMVEGFPEGPYDANDVKTKLKGLHMITDEQWKKWFAGNSKVYIYRPRIISRFDKPLDYKSEQGQQV